MTHPAEPGIYRPALRYHGGKWRLAKWIIQFFPAHRVYVEPFAGGASVLLQKARSYSEVYNDLDSEVVNVFRVLRDPPNASRLRELLELTPYSREDFAQAFQPANDPIEQARRTILKSFAGFGSSAIHSSTSGNTGFRTCEHHPNRPLPTGFRNTALNSGTTPAHDWMHYPEEIDKFRARLQGVVIENRPAAEVIEKFDRPECLFYCDPPYPMATRDPGRDYRHEMLDDDHRALAAQLHAASGMVVISGYRCPLYDEELYADWFSRERDHFAQGAKRSVEVVWMNQAARSKISQGRLF